MYESPEETCALAVPSTVETRHGERGEGQSHIALHVIQHGLLADDTFLSLGATVVATILSRRTAATAAKAERVGFGECGNCRKFILRSIRSANRLFRLPPRKAFSRQTLIHKH